jgi:NADP-dependent 3-hydroxy acid dehydrogenase YdfG
VTPLTLDVTSAAQILRAMDEIDTLDVLINNAGVANSDDVSNPEAIERQFAAFVQGSAGA